MVSYVVMTVRVCSSYSVGVSSVCNYNNYYGNNDVGGMFDGA